MKTVSVMNSVDIVFGSQYAKPLKFGPVKTSSFFVKVCNVFLINFHKKVLKASVPVKFRICLLHTVKAFERQKY